MLSKNNVVRAAIVSLGAALLSAPAQAVLISFDPVTSTVFEGGTVDVGIRVSGLEDGQDEIVSAFDLDVLFDAAIVMATGFTFGAELGSDLDSFFDHVFDNNVATGGLADLWQVSLLSSELLAATQGASVLLGQLHFAAVGVGQSSLAFGEDPLFGRNVVGRDPFSSLPVTAALGAVTVLARPVNVPEPATLALLGPALLALFAARRRRGASQRSIRLP